MALRYLFDDEHFMQRVFVLYGNTNDFFMTLTRGSYSVAPLLESHLGSLGYDVVLFYNGGKTLKCFEQAHAENRRKFFPLAHEKSAPPAPPEWAEAPASPAPEGAGKLRRRPRPLRTARAAAADRDKASAAPLQFDMPVNGIADYLNGIMVNREVKSAVIFGNAGNLFIASEQNNKLAEYISGWYGLRSNNNNIAILLFQERNLEALPEMLRLNIAWRFLYENIFVERKDNDALIRIGAPRQDELFFFLNAYVSAFRNGDALLRQYGVDQQSVMAAAGRLISCNNRRLTSLKSFVERHRDDPLAALLRQYGASSETNALERIRDTEGWEDVYEVVSRIIDSARRGHREEVDSSFPRDNYRNMRLARDSEAAHYDINLSMVLKGNPGTGKTTVARWIGEALRQNGLLSSGHIVKVTRQDLVAGYVGQTALRTGAKLDEARGGILFVDEAYALFRKGTGSESGDFGIEAIETILEAMTDMRGEICVIFAGYPEEMDNLLTQANSGLMRRFEGNIINISDYPPKLLERIVLSHIAQSNQAKLETGYRLNFSISAGLCQADAADGGPAQAPEALMAACRQSREENTPLCPWSVYFDNWFADRDARRFGNAGAAVELAELMMSNALRRSGASATEIVIDREDFPEGTEKFFVCRKPTIAEVEKQLKDVVGMEKVKQTLKRVTSYMQLLRAQQEVGARLRRSWKNDIRIDSCNYLFVGNPGVGKTMIAEKLALTLSTIGVIRRYTPIRATGLDLINCVQKEGIEGLKRYIDGCRGSVITIDEAHQLAQYGGGSMVVKALLDPMLDRDMEICFVFCCYPNQREQLLRLDEGFARRINDVFLFEDYAPDEVTQIFGKIAQRNHYRIDDAVMEAALEKFRVLHRNPRYWENGATAEKLFQEARISIALRLMGGRSLNEIVEAAQSDEAEEAALLTITPEDIEQGFRHMLHNLQLKAGGREEAAVYGEAEDTHP